MRKNLENVLTNSSNASLVLHKYLAKPAGDDSDNSKRKDLMKEAKNSLENVEEIYNIAYNRWKAFLEADPAVVKKDLHTDGNMIVGLGSDNVLETGITLNHTYGVPYIPGTALKGLAAHYCNEVWGSRDEDFRKGGAYYKEIFGDNTQAGHIIFFDAWITPDTMINCLNLDIMTPHNADYYSGTKALPSDCESPTPITFLSVKGTFTVALSCDVKDSKGEALRNLTLGLLKSALEEWGVGAKTSSGYGRLNDKIIKEEIKKQPNFGNKELKNNKNYNSGKNNKSSGFTIADRF